MASDLSLICSWSFSSTVEIQALNEAGVLLFRQIEDQKVSEISLEKIRGVIPLENLSKTEVSKVYQLLKPVKYSDSEWVLSVVNDEFDVEYPYKEIKVAIFLEKQTLRLKIESTDFKSSTKAVWSLPFTEINGGSSKIFSKVTNSEHVKEIIHLIQQGLAKFSAITGKGVIRVFDKQFTCFTFYNKPELIFIKMLSGKTIPIFIDCWAKVEELKEKILKKEGVLVQQQRLLFDGKQLEDGRMLFYYKISQKSTVHCVLGGMLPLMLPPLAKANETILLFDKAPFWREVSPGLNIRGICHNEQCKAFEDIVWVAKEYGEFLMRKEVVTSAACPCCKQQLSEVDNVGFTQCRFSIRGKALDSNGNEVIIERLKVKAPDDGLLTFEGMKINYVSLTITVESLEIILELIKSVFQLFSRASSTTRRNYGE